MSWSHLAFGMLHVTGVIISTVFFLHLLRMGHEKRDCIALIGLVIVGLLSIWNATCYGGHYFYCFFYIFSEWGMRKEIALPWLGLWLLGYRGPKQRSLQLLKAYQRRVYLYQQKLQGIGGSMVEFCLPRGRSGSNSRPMQGQPPFK